MRWLAAAVAGCLAAAHPAHAAGTAPPGRVEITAEQQKTVQLQMARAERRPITQPVHVTGTVGFDPGHVAILRPPGQARIIRLLVQAGDVVAAGQPLAEIDLPGLATTEQDLAAAQASVREAEAGVAVAREALHRGEVLARDGSLARAEADRRRLALAQAVAALDTAQARARALQTEIRRLNPTGQPGIAQLPSPLSGVVASVGVTPGEMTDASREAFVVADLSVVLVMAQVPEASAAQVAVNDPAQISLASGGRHWDGRVATLGAALDPQARTLPARIQLANADGVLRAGMYVDVTITDELGREAVVVPSAAVQMVADKHVVFTPAGEGMFQSHDVQVGVEWPDWVELRGGIAAGEQVVTQGSFALKSLLQQTMLGGG